MSASRPTSAREETGSPSGLVSFFSVKRVPNSVQLRVKFFLGRHKRERLTRGRATQRLTQADPICWQVPTIQPVQLSLYPP
jgi:hypothetical protein